MGPRRISAGLLLLQVSLRRTRAEHQRELSAAALRGR